MATPRPTGRELFHQVMTFSAPGTTLATLGGIWPSTLDRWETEGMPLELRDMNRLLEHFGLEPHIWGNPDAALYVWPLFDKQVLSEDETTVTYTNEYGITCRDFRENAYQSMPHFESFPLHTHADWDAYRERLVWSPERVGAGWEQQKTDWRQRTAPLIIALNRGASLYGSLREMFGMEQLSYLFCDDPAWLAEIMDVMVALCVGAVGTLFADFVPDAVCLWEDMAYKTGSLLSVRHVRELMVPRYQIMTAALRRAGVPFIFEDSDGYIDDLIPLWLEGGFDGMVPMEANSGMDVALYREKYPRLLMIGGVDKRAFSRDHAAVEHEIHKIEQVIATGGLLPFFDHGLPHDATWDNFQYYVRRLKEVTGR
ncbi:MAG TPA: hypothetical protein VGM19_12515 [Armatimonadota bacterium]|jgi:uroporphyrinogen decarboxylase